MFLLIASSIIESSPASKKKNRGNATLPPCLCVDFNFPPTRQLRKLPVARCYKGALTLPRLPTSIPSRLDGGSFLFTSSHQASFPPTSDVWSSPAGGSLQTRPGTSAACRSLICLCVSVCLKCRGLSKCLSSGGNCGRRLGGIRNIF